MKKVRNKTNGIFKVILATTVVTLGSMASAQTPPPPRVYHPGDILRITVSFAGPEAGKISRVWMHLSLTSAPQTGQAGFSTNIDSGDAKKTVLDTFEISYTIPTNQATGEYRLNNFNTIIDQDAPISFNYGSPDSFPAFTFRIENPKTIVKPTVSGVTVP